MRCRIDVDAYRHRCAERNAGVPTLARLPTVPACTIGSRIPRRGFMSTYDTRHRGIPP